MTTVDSTGGVGGREFKDYDKREGKTKGISTSSVWVFGNRIVRYEQDGKEDMNLNAQSVLNFLKSNNPDKYKSITENEKARFTDRFRFRESTVTAGDQADKKIIEILKETLTTNELKAKNANAAPPESEPPVTVTSVDTSVPVTEESLRAYYEAKKLGKSDSSNKIPYTKDQWVKLASRRNWSPAASKEEHFYRLDQFAQRLRATTDERKNLPDEFEEIPKEVINIFEKLLKFETHPEKQKELKSFFVTSYFYCTELQQKDLVKLCTKINTLVSGYHPKPDILSILKTFPLPDSRTTTPQWDQIFKNAEQLIRGVETGQHLKPNLTLLFQVANQPNEVIMEAWELLMGGMPQDYLKEVLPLLAKAKCRGIGGMIKEKAGSTSGELLIKNKNALIELIGNMSNENNPIGQRELLNEALRKLESPPQRKSPTSSKRGSPASSERGSPTPSETGSVDKPRSPLQNRK